MVVNGEPPVVAHSCRLVLPPVTFTTHRLLPEHAIAEGLVIIPLPKETATLRGFGVEVGAMAITVTGLGLEGELEPQENWKNIEAEQRINKNKYFFIQNPQV